MFVALIARMFFTLFLKRGKINMTLGELKKYIVSISEELDNEKVIVSISSDFIGTISIGGHMVAFGCATIPVDLDSICIRNRYVFPEFVDH
jgi:hypothetical protein